MKCHSQWLFSAAKGNGSFQQSQRQVQMAASYNKRQTGARSLQRQWKFRFGKMKRARSIASRRQIGIL
jgi:hypothetical protein